jgi:hypothetical protein
MKKVAGILVLSLVFCECGWSQVIFQKQLYRGNLSEAKQTSDGGYIASGWYSDTISRGYACLLKTNLFGDTIWTRTFRESVDVFGMSVELTSDSGYIIAGGTYPGPVDSGDVYLVKTDVNGDTLWTKKIGGTGNDEARCIRQTFDGGYIISAESNSFNSGSQDMYIIKTDSIGNPQWSNDGRCK